MSTAFTGMALDQEIVCPLPNIIPYPDSPDDLSMASGDAAPMTGEVVTIIPPSGRPASRLASNNSLLQQDVQTKSTSNPEDYSPSESLLSEECEFVTNNSSSSETTIMRLERQMPEERKSPSASVLSSSLLSTTPRVRELFVPHIKELPQIVISRIIGMLDLPLALGLRRVSRMWLRAYDKCHPLKFPPVYYLPTELIQQIFNFCTPESFNAVRHCSKAWYRSSMDPKILQEKFRVMGFSETDPLVRGSGEAGYLSKRLARECSLGSDGSGKCRLRNCAVVDLSELTATGCGHFTVSICGSHVMVCEGCAINIYRLQGKDTLMEFVASIVCPRRVLAVSMDTSSRRYSVAVLLV